METLFRSILCPIDFDRVSIPAVEMVRKIGKQSSSRAILLYVIPAEGAKDEVRVARDSMRAIAVKWFEGVMPHEIVVRAGDPAQEIIRAANDLDADLIVMATHGRTGIQHFLLGSVAERVVREAERPVLTVRPLDHE